MQIGNVSDYNPVGTTERKVGKQSYGSGIYLSSCKYDIPKALSKTSQTECQDFRIRVDAGRS